MIARGVDGLVALVLLCTAAASGSAQQTVLPGTTASPTLVRLDSAVRSGDRRAVAAFWDRIEHAGAPLVEPDSTHPGYSLVTFLYRAGADTLDVDLVSNITSLDPHAEATSTIQLPLYRIAGTDVRALAFRLRNDIRAPYHFRVHRPGQEPVVVLDSLNLSVWEPEQPGFRASILELSGAPAQPWREVGAEAGHWDEPQLTDAAGQERTVYIYKPLGWRADRSEPYPALVGLGAYGTGIGMRVDWMEDHLIRAGLLPPMVIALVDLKPGSEATRYRPTDAFVVDVVLPYLREHYQVSHRPERIAVSGSSRRGMVAALLALRHPDAVGNVISLSGSYYWKPTDEKDWVWVPAQYARSALRTIRLYVAAGELETFVNPGNHGHYMVGANRQFRDILRARGYDLDYVEFNGVHSELNWQDWLADGLLHLFGYRGIEP